MLTDDVLIAIAHALHNPFIITEKTGFDWPDAEDESLHFIEEGTLIRAIEVTFRAGQIPYDPFEIFVTVEWDSGPDQITEWVFPFEFLTDRCDLLEAESDAYPTH